MSEESDIKKLIMDYLKVQPGCYARVIQIGRIPGRNNSSKGISDIIGVWKGKFLAIEVKTKSTKTTIEQDEFLECVKKAGGIAIVARSLADVENVLNRGN